MTMNSVTTAGGRETKRNVAFNRADLDGYPQTIHRTLIEQRVIRQAAEVPLCSGDAGPVDLIDLEFALTKMKSGKAPGADSISPVLIKITTYISIESIVFGLAYMNSYQNSDFDDQKE